MDTHPHLLDMFFSDALSPLQPVEPARDASVFSQLQARQSRLDGPSNQCLTNAYFPDGMPYCEMEPPSPLLHDFSMATSEAALTSMFDSVPFDAQFESISLPAR